MKRPLAMTASLALLLPCAAHANDEIQKLSKDDGQWVTPSKNYASTRFSGLAQITTANVGKLREAWSFSTGALRGHEGQPLVVGSTMFVHSAYPNHIYALDLAKHGLAASAVAEARAAWPDKFLWLHPPLGWYEEPSAELQRRIRQMVRDAGPRRFCLMISEDVPPNWERNVPLVLECLRGSA